MSEIKFATAFEALTGNGPFPWQQDLYDNWFSRGKFPDSCALPTGLGKTAVIPIWLIALANNPGAVPRRLVYVVNRRTVVDQATREAENIRENIGKVPGLADRLRGLSATGADAPLAISTLRGQFADNREWSADPSRPAVIVGTVDMVGSRLLFSGYGVGFKAKPLHAGFLGQDVLLVHDEAHLEPAFQDLITAIRDEQQRSHEFRPFHVVELSATSRGRGDTFTLGPADHRHPEVARRTRARKAIHLVGNGDEKKLAEEVAELARKHEGTGRAVLVFVRKVEDVDKVVKKLPKGRVEKLTGTLRGLERDGLVNSPIFQRFLPESNRKKDAAPAEGTVYLVCTSAGEVGVNISADHLVSDLSTFDSMAQRFGRVNRFGRCDDTRIDVVYPKSFREADDYEGRLKKTLELLRLADGDGSPANLGELHRRAIREGSDPGLLAGDRAEALREYILATYAPPPTILPTSDILFDAWALTTVRGQLPGRPPVADYLHGVEEDKLADTYVAWREEVELVPQPPPAGFDPEELLEQCPLRPHELVRDRTYRVAEALAALANRAAKSTARDQELSVWVLEPDGEVNVLPMSKLAEKDGQRRPLVPLAERTVLLPPSAGGLAGGMLKGDEPYDETDRSGYDVAGAPAQAFGPQTLRLLASPVGGDWEYRPIGQTNGLPKGFKALVGEPDRFRQLKGVADALRAAGVPAMRITYQTDLPGPDDEDAGARRYLVFRPERPRKSGGTAPAAWPLLDDHHEGVLRQAEALCSRLGLPQDVARAVVLAARWHDLGKGRRVWQVGAGNRPGVKPVSKPLHGRPPENLNHFRHELGSVIDVCGDPALAAEFRSQEAWTQELTLHLIAAHHGRARPHFPPAEGYDPERPDASAGMVATATPGRYARLRRRYGCWGLAYLESLVRAADALDSKRIEDTPTGEEEAGEWPGLPKGFACPQPPMWPEPIIRIHLDPRNPGQFFACCGLFELADRLWFGVEGWFSPDATEFCLAPLDSGRAGGGTGLLQALATCRLTNTMREEEVRRREELSAKRKREMADGEEDDKKALDRLWREAPLVFGDPFRLRVDWFTDGRAGGDRFKTWAGQQSVIEIARAMKGPVEAGGWEGIPPAEWLTRTGGGVPFNFDADLGGQSSSLDVGFSLDPLGMSTRTRPLIELAALVGLQRFRPRSHPTENRHTYTAWGGPLLPAAAAAAAAGAIGHPGWPTFEFQLLYRTKYLKSFLPATPIGGDR